jgi:hypothetical protein
VTETLVCWRCGAELDEILPLSRRAVCRACNAEQHVCKLCRHYDPRIADQCREERAEAVTDKERANFCDYFEPRPNAYTPTDDTAARSARADLDALFGLSVPSGSQAAPKPSDPAREELERLFGLDKKPDSD